MTTTRDEVLALAEELREFTALKYMGDCKCGKCQLVPRELIDRLYAALRSPIQGREADDYFDMLWEWFEDESRIGAEGMRPERIDGLSADDFKTMLDEHEASLLDAALSPPGNSGREAVNDFANTLVDWVYLYATEGQGWPDYSTISAKLIALARQRKPTQADADLLKNGTSIAALSTGAPGGGASDDTRADGGGAA